MDLPRDFSELLASFNANGVEYMLVGGYALAHHGTPRFTGDLDLYVHPTPDNARRIQVDGQPVPVIGLREFVTNKRASGRPTDLADLDALGEA